MITSWRAQRYMTSYSALVRRLGVIRDDFEHSCALARCQALIERDSAKDSPEGIELDQLATIVESYERTRWPIVGAHQ